MFKYSTNSKLKYLLILCLSLTLLIAQASGLHVHLQHDDHSSAVTNYIPDVHTASILHDSDLATHYSVDHSATIDISSENVVKKANLLPPLVLVLLFIGFLISIPHFVKIHWQRLYKIQLIPCYYLLHPALRAPPL